MKKDSSRPPAPGKFITVDGIRVHVQEQGEGGPELLLLHGYLASSAIWEPVMHGLAPFGRVVAIDLPGSGYSEKPTDAPYTIAWFADFVVALMSRLNLRKPVLGGHSLGGAVALHVAFRYSDLLRALVLVSPFVYAPSPPPGLKIARIWPGPMRALFKSSVGRLFISGMVRRAVYSSRHNSFLAKQSARRLLYHLDAQGGWDAATKIGLQAHNYSPGADMLKEITKPSLVLWGGRDQAHKLTMATDLIGDLAGPSKLTVFENSAHNCHEEEPERFCAIVNDWIQALEGD